MVEIRRKGRMVPSPPSFLPFLDDVKEDSCLSLAPPEGAQILAEVLGAGAMGFLQ